MTGSNFLINQKGIAMVEMLPLLAVFVLLFGLLFGFWSSIHSGTLHSISARRYAFEVINNRTHFIYHRDSSPPTDRTNYYGKNGTRFFATVELTDNPKLISEKTSFNLFDSAGLRITGDPQSQTTQTEKEQGIHKIKIKTGYGICIDFDCGD